MNHKSPNVPARKLKILSRQTRIDGQKEKHLPKERHKAIYQIGRSRGDQK